MLDSSTTENPYEYSGVSTMKVIVFVKATDESEAGVMPSEQLGLRRLKNI
jgi:hypothetical protein